MATIETLREKIDVYKSKYRKKYLPEIEEGKIYSLNKDITIKGLLLLFSGLKHGPFRIGVVSTQFLVMSNYCIWVKRRNNLWAIDSVVTFTMGRKNILPSQRQGIHGQILPHM